MYTIVFSNSNCTSLSRKHKMNKFQVDLLPLGENFLLHFLIHLS